MYIYTYTAGSVLRSADPCSYQRTVCMLSVCALSSGDGAPQGSKYMIVTGLKRAGICTT